MNACVKIEQNGGEYHGYAYIEGAESVELIEGTTSVLVNKSIKITFDEQIVYLGPEATAP